MVRDTGEPAVLVVDYAETRPGLADLLAEAATAEDCPDLRVLLLARSAREWWRQLRVGADYRLSQVLEDTEPLPLGPLAGGRQGLFDDAVATFADRFGVARPQARLMLNDPGAVVLAVRAAALLAVLDHAITGSGSRRVYSVADVLTALLGHEARYSVFLSDLGRREEALAAIEEAVTIRRELARTPQPCLASVLQPRPRRSSASAGRPARPSRTVDSADHRRGTRHWYRRMAEVRWSMCAIAVGALTNSLLLLLFGR